MATQNKMFQHFLNLLRKQHTARNSSQSTLRSCNGIGGNFFASSPASVTFQTHSCNQVIKGPLEKSFEKSPSRTSRAAVASVAVGTALAAFLGLSGTAYAYAEAQRRLPVPPPQPFEPPDARELKDRQQNEDLKLPEREESADRVVEPNTGVQFPKQVLIRRPKEEAGDYRLVGTAVRCMLGQCRFAYARAYAVAVYVASGEHSARWNDPSKAPESDEALRRELLEATGVTRRLVLVMDRDVEGHHIAKGFDRSLIPRVREGQGGFKKGPGKDALRQFTRYFNSQKMLRKGTQVELVWRPDNSLVTVLDGRVMGVLSSHVLCHSLFDTYFGPNSVFAKYNNTSFVFLKNKALL